MGYLYTFLVVGGDGSPAPNPNDPMSSTEVYASMIGQELVTSYQQAILANGGTPRSDSSSESKPSPPIKTEPVRTNGVLPDSEFFRERNGHLSPTEIAALNQRKLSTRERESLDCSNGPMLDTSEVALRIRDILSSHNIGQRLFAKHVLGLSQGTVSELLSKPKHWDKLTEKGRESYRKMYQWSCDDANINELKAISPKKGELSD
ncbi:unnamed protein product [Owenia fusiformis]|uniref:CUT domain-containing protein n=1 Tax=Owenia fusiformis TaxID=6347 RepID=A0A8S4Q4X4_OWEFU|nr:unnamed protein product [Owenia fusiformis]